MTALCATMARSTGQTVGHRGRNLGVPGLPVTDFRHTFAGGVK